jgi:DNA invertase Pin-like site-specific DNA recombinase
MLKLLSLVVSPSTAGSAPTICRVRARNETCAHLPGAPTTTSSAFSRRRRQAPRTNRAERKKVMALAQAHEIDAILVTELSRWSRSTQDLVQTLDDLHSWKVSLLAQTALSFDLSTASGKLMCTIMAGLAEFERDLIRDRVKSGLAAARARGGVLGRQVGQRPSDKKAKRVLAMHRDGLSYRLIGRNLGLSKNTVMEIVRRAAA